MPNKVYKRYRTNIDRSPQTLFSCTEENGNEIKSIYIANLHSTESKEVGISLTDLKGVIHYICLEIDLPPKDVLILNTPFNMIKGDTLNFVSTSPDKVDITISY